MLYRTRATHAFAYQPGVVCTELATEYNQQRTVQKKEVKDLGCGLHITYVLLMSRDEEVTVQDVGILTIGSCLPENLAELAN